MGNLSRKEEGSGKALWHKLTYKVYIRERRLVYLEHGEVENSKW